MAATPLIRHPVSPCLPPRGGRLFVLQKRYRMASERGPISISSQVRGGFGVLQNGEDLTGWVWFSCRRSRRTRRSDEAANALPVRPVYLARLAPCFAP